MDTHSFKPAPAQPLGQKKTRVEVSGQNPMEIFSYLLLMIQEDFEFDQERFVSENSWKLTFSGVYEEEKKEDESDEEEENK